MVSVDVFAHALLWSFDAASLKSVIGLHAHMLYYYRYCGYRMLRPQVRRGRPPGGGRGSRC